MRRERMYHGCTYCMPAVMNKRNTIQKMLILDAVRSMSNHPTAQEIYGVVCERCPTISKGTVYRNLNALADDGDILRVTVANAPDRYDKTAYEHCHFRCRGCGRVYDFKLPHEVEIDNTLNPDFIAEDYVLLVNGLCSSCICERRNDNGQQSAV